MQQAKTKTKNKKKTNHPRKIGKHERGWAILSRVLQLLFVFRDTSVIVTRLNVCCKKQSKKTNKK